MSYNPDYPYTRLAECLDDCPTIQPVLPDPRLTGGVIGVRCACCGKWIIINRSAYDGDLQFCRDCMELPESQAETMIMAREVEIWQPANYTQYLPL